MKQGTEKEVGGEGDAEFGLDSIAFELPVAQPCEKSVI